MAGDLVLLTGATGHLGFRTLVLLLEAGYHVRAVLRDPSKAAKILAAPSLRRFANNNNHPTNPALTFVTIPDLTVPGAYDAAVRSVTHIIHVASPLPAGQAVAPADYAATYIQPAVDGTLNLLEAARRHGGPQLTRVVVTSSVVALGDFATFFSGEACFAPDARASLASEPAPELPTTPGADFPVYAVAKAVALNEAEAWMHRQRRGGGVGVGEASVSFDLVHVHPAFVLGANELATTVREAVAGSNGMVVQMVLGKKTPVPIPATVVHLDDAAEAHVKALAPGVKTGEKGTRSFVVVGDAKGEVQWEDALEVVKKVFPAEVGQGVLPNDGKQPSVFATADVKDTEEVLGIKHKGFEEMVRSAVGHVLEVAKAPGQQQEFEKVKAEYAQAE
ncbi:MAG: hypothetical protein Q9165_002781 [Trypethelium subeluteriae]